MSLESEDKKPPYKPNTKEPIEISFDTIRYCKRGHGMLPKDGRCPECSKGGWLTSPLSYVLYGLAAAVLSIFYIGFDKSMGKLGSGSIYIFIFFPQCVFSWGLVMAIVEHKFRKREVPSSRPRARAAYRRAMDCAVCGDRLNKEGWCEGCSRKRTVPLIQLLIVLLPIFGVTSCFTLFLIGSESPLAALVIVILALPPVIAAVARYRATLPQK